LPPRALMEFWQLLTAIDRASGSLPPEPTPLAVMGLHAPPKPHRRNVPIAEQVTRPPPAAGCGGLVACAGGFTTAGVVAVVAGASSSSSLSSSLVVVVVTEGCSELPCSSRPELIFAACCFAKKYVMAPIPTQPAAPSTIMPPIMMSTHARVDSPCFGGGA
jgi:hypothetical protein